MNSVQSNNAIEDLIKAKNDSSSGVTDAKLYNPLPFNFFHPNTKIKYDSQISTLLPTNDDIKRYKHHDFLTELSGPIKESQDNLNKRNFSDQESKLTKARLEKTANTSSTNADTHTTPDKNNSKNTSNLIYASTQGH